MFQLIIFFISIQAFSQSAWTNFNTDNSPIAYNQINSIEFVSNINTVLTTNENKVLERVVNILGQDIINYENNEHNRVLFMIYSDGSVEKVLK